MANIFATYNAVEPPEGYTPPKLDIIDTTLNEDYNPVAQLFVDNNNIQLFTDKYTFEQEEPSFKLFTTTKEVKRTEHPRPPLKKGYVAFSGNKKEFINKMRPIYKEVLRSKGLNESYADYLVAQSALESAWGKSQAGKNNFGGIKGKGSVKTTTEFINGKYVKTKDSFRDFNSLRDYAEYHVNLLNNRYKAFNGDFISSVVKGGYATDPKYASKLLNMYKSVIS